MKSVILKRKLTSGLFLRFIELNKIVIFETQLFPKNEFTSYLTLTKQRAELTAFQDSAFLNLPLRGYSYNWLDTYLSFPKNLQNTTFSPSFLKFNNLVFIKTCTVSPFILNRGLLEKILFRLFTTSLFFFFRGASGLSHASTNI